LDIFIIILSDALQVIAQLQAIPYPVLFSEEYWGCSSLTSPAKHAD